MGSKWSIILNTGAPLGIRSITTQSPLMWSLIITPLAPAIKLAIRKAVVPWIPSKGPEDVETQCDLTSRAARGCVDSEDCHGEMPVGINNNQGNTTPGERGGKDGTKMEHRILWYKKPSLKGCAKSFRNNRGPDRRRLLGSGRREEFLFLLSVRKAMACIKAH